MKKLGVLASLVIVFPLISVSIASGQTVILNEHFDSSEALANWEDTSATGNQFSIQNGVLVSNELYENLGPLVYRGTHGYGLNLPDSFQITLRVRKTDDGYTGSDEIHIFVPFLDAENKVHTGWRQRVIEDWHFRIFQSGVSVFERGEGPLNFDEMQWHIVRVVKDNLKITTYINDNLVYSETISELAYFQGLAGTIALNTSTGRFEFDYVTVTTLKDEGNFYLIPNKTGGPAIIYLE
jgi:hypothetical protein